MSMVAFGDRNVRLHICACAYAPAHLRLYIGHAVASHLKCSEPIGIDPGPMSSNLGDGGGTDSELSGLVVGDGVGLG